LPKIPRREYDEIRFREFMRKQELRDLRKDFVMSDPTIPVLTYVHCPLCGKTHPYERTDDMGNVEETGFEFRDFSEPSKFSKSIGYDSSHFRPFTVVTKRKGGGRYTYVETDSAGRVIRKETMGTGFFRVDGEDKTIEDLGREKHPIFFDLYKKAKTLMNELERVKNKFNLDV